MTSCSGLPICLSGIQIFPQRQRSVPRRVRPHMQPHPHTSPTCACMPAGESVGSDCEASSLATASPLGIACDHDDAREERNSDLFRNASTWPRLAIVQQMADLEGRREAVRRQNLQNRSHLMDYRVSPQQNNLMVACLESQARPEEGSSCTSKSICAKAA